MKANYGFIVEDAEGCAVFSLLANALEYERLAIVHGSRALTIKTAVLTYGEGKQHNSRRVKNFVNKRKKGEK